MKMPLFLFVVISIVATWGNLSKVAVGQGIVIDTIQEDPTITWSDREFWETGNGKPASDGWEFADGEIRLVKPRKGGNILSPALPPNFELSWQWKIAKGTNSGLKYRVRRFGKQLFSNNLLGIEYQIIDDKSDSMSKGSTGAIYDLVAPKSGKKLNPPQQWNHSRIVANGDSLQHYLNGELVSSATTVGAPWEATIALSKFYSSVDFGRPKEGDRIMLTDHGGQVSYKDFQFTALESPAASPIIRTAPFLANGMRNSWADQNSIVLWTRTTAVAEMKADGTKFITISKKDASKIAKQKDETMLNSIQLPEGAKLENMFGACPGIAGEVRLTYFPSKQRNQAKSIDWVTTKAENDFATQWKLEGLKANTQYAVVIESRAIGSKETSAVIRGAFRTPPKTNAKENLKFCITTCHDFIRRDDGLTGHKIYPAMTKIKPHFVVHAGDIEYYDKPDPWAWTIDLMRFKWQRIFALPSNREFYKNTTSYFIKDDHDTLTNDSWPGRTYGSVTFAQGVELFNQEQFPSHPTRYQSVNWGKDLQVWILEGRDYRSANDMPDGPDKTILGAEQKQWLFKTLSESDAKFKLICSPTPIVGPDRANKRDNHANDVFAHEGVEIREKLAAIDGVIVLCGDRHWQYASVDEKTNLWEFGCGPGSEKHQLGWKPNDKRPVHEFLRVAGGFLSGELVYRGKDKQPRLTLRHHKVTGEEVSKFQFPVESKSDAAKPKSKQTANKDDPGSDKPNQRKEKAE